MAYKKVEIVKNISWIKNREALEDAPSDLVPDDLDVSRISDLLDKLLNKLEESVESLTSDLMTLALRLMGEDESTFSPEVAEVMARWKPLLEELVLNPQILKKEK